MVKLWINTLLVLVCSYQWVNAQTILKNGDLLFQNLDCGELCDAIEKVTYGKDDLKFSHIGLVAKQADTLVVIEAIGKEVCATSIKQFCARTTNPIYWARPALTDSVLGITTSFALKQIGVAYDDVFLYNNQKYYCSELIYDAFKYADNCIFTLEPMTFKDPETGAFLPAWTKYYKKQQIAIPEGEPGINPAGISRSEKIIWLGVYNP